MSHVEKLREEFDAGFRLPLGERAEKRESLLVVRVGERKLALGIAGLLGLERVQAVTAVESPVRALLGLAGVHGLVVPVFSVGALLGGEAEMSAGWERRPLFGLARTEDGERVGLAFDRLERFLQVEAETVVAGPEGRVARVDGETMAVVEVQTLVAMVES